jgi:hypothetical protein
MLTYAHSDIYYFKVFSYGVANESNGHHPPSAISLSSLVTDSVMLEEGQRTLQQQTAYIMRYVVLLTFQCDIH